MRQTDGRVPAAGDRTWDDVDPERDGRGSAVTRRTAMTVLATFCAVGATGAWGVATRTVRREGVGLAVAVTYPRVARPGLDVVMRIEVVADPALEGPLEVAIDLAYLRRFEAQAVQPEPDTQLSRADAVVWSWDVPTGTTRWVVEVDHYVQPGSLRGAPGTLGVTTADGRYVDVPVPLTLMP